MVTGTRQREEEWGKTVVKNTLEFPLSSVVCMKLYNKVTEFRKRSVWKAWLKFKARYINNIMFGEKKYFDKLITPKQLIRVI